MVDSNVEPIVVDDNNTYPVDRGFVKVASAPVVYPKTITFDWRTKRTIKAVHSSINTSVIAITVECDGEMKILHISNRKYGKPVLQALKRLMEEPRDEKDIKFVIDTEYFLSCKWIEHHRVFFSEEDFAEFV